MKKISFISILNRSMGTYAIICKPVCDKLHMPLPALQILMTLADNPELTTAKEISIHKALKPTLISFYVEKLVQAGYLERQSIKGNRRSVKLVCTDKALPIIEQGRKINKLYFSLITEGFSDEEISFFRNITEKIDRNMEAIREKAAAGELISSAGSE
ncbi:MAG: MarR family transcriptional regulator [Ruminococcus sp.]|nr:MarR family transcriptional regulator [Ruminococcus sp.]MDE7225531.1 MarR family transcriptional regulator [Ruminococcus sp.]